MKKSIIILFFIVLFAGISNAQNYNTAIGLRAGTFSGVTVKHFIAGNQAIEGLFTWRWQSAGITGLYEFQQPIPGVTGLDWLIGGGAHIAFIDPHYYGNWKDPYGERYTAVGLDFILGLELTLKPVPFNFAIDWKPAFNIVGDSNWWYDGGALSIRYYF